MSSRKRYCEHAPASPPNMSHNTALLVTRGLPGLVPRLFPCLFHYVGDDSMRNISLFPCNITAWKGALKYYTLCIVQLITRGLPSSIYLVHCSTN